MGPCLRFHERTAIWGWEVLPGSRTRMFLVLTAEGGENPARRSVACRSFWMPNGARSNRVSGAVLEVSGKNRHWGWEFLPGCRARMFLVLMAEGGQSPASRSVACGSFWMPKGACSNRVSRAMNGAVIEVSAKNHHSGLGGLAWEQGPDIFNFDGRRRAMASEPLRRMSEFLDA